ncbi:conserved hypothetical protein [Candidatus Terasakiella magnetica]|nr:conserved hypothetical protein [Candidatus Terasakiella magnetica]
MTASPPFTLAHTQAEHWGSAAKICLEGLGDAVKGANLGILYASESFSPNLSSILTFLRETTHIAHWVGGAVPGICAGATEYRAGGALAVMVGHLPEAQLHVFSEDAGDWAARHGSCVALVHGDPRAPQLPGLLDQLGRAAFLVGGLMSVSGPPAQIADSVATSGLSGVVLGPEIEALTGMTQGCSPIGPAHTITELWDGVIMALDGRPALEVLRGEVGELLARDLRRIAGYIHVAIPVEGSDQADYRVRSLIGIDPNHGWLAIGDTLTEGDRLIFVRRDANAARADLKRMLAEIKVRLGPRPIRAGFYVSCAARGQHMFGAPGIEPALIHDALGDFPLIGFFANGEICRDNLYGFTGVLTLLPGETG